MALATLSIDLEARLAKMEQGFDKASRLSEKSAEKIERAFAKNRKAAEDIGKAIVAAFSVRQIAVFIKGTIDSVDALNDLKDATGASIENISALEDIGARAGHSFESVSTSLIRFNKVLQDADKEGSEAARVLQALGLNAEELRRLDPAEALRQTAVAMAQFADDGDKARAVQILFGKSVQEVVPFLNDLAEQGKLVATVTTEQAKAADEFNKQLFQLQKNVVDASRSILSDLLPALNKLFDKGKSQGFFSIFGFDKEFSDKKRLAEAAAEVIKFDGYLKKMKADKEGGVGYFKDVDASIAKTTAQLEEAKKRFRELDNQLQAPNQASYSNEGRNSPAPSIGSIPEAGKPTKTKTSKSNGGPFVGPGIDASLLRERNELEREFQSLLERTPTAKLEAQRELQVFLADAYKEGRITLEDYLEVVKTSLPEAVETASTEMQKLSEESNKFFEQAAANIQDAFGDTLKRTLKGDFDSIGELWENLLIDMLAQAAAAQLNRALFGDIGGGGGTNWGGLIGGLVSMYGGGGFGTGNSYGNQDLGAFLADGTNNVPYDGFRAVLHKGEAVVPAKYNPAQGGAGTPTIVINQTNNIGQGVSRGEVEAAVRAANAETKISIQRSLRQGGY